jgi:hypothetical protein
MNVPITEEIIDAIIQNDRRHGQRPSQNLPAWVPKGIRNLAVLKPVWGQLPPGAI